MTTSSAYFVAERIATGELTREEAAPMTLALLAAGHETTANMIGLGTLALLRHPEQLALMRDSDDPRVIMRRGRGTAALPHGRRQRDRPYGPGGPHHRRTTCTGR